MQIDLKNSHQGYFPPMSISVDIMFMSGVEDGRLVSLSSENGDGISGDAGWAVRFGRKEDNDIWLRYDSFASRYHARVYFRGQRWWLEDCDSKNGTFLELDDDDEARVSGSIPIELGQLFRVGRTWFRIQDGIAE